jgi:hypothetical protein
MTATMSAHRTSSRERGRGQKGEMPAERVPYLPLVIWRNTASAAGLRDTFPVQTKRKFTTRF